VEVRGHFGTRSSGLKASLSPTLSGKTGELLGFLALMLGIKLRHPGLLAFGSMLMMAVVWAALRARARIRGVSAEIRRPARVRAFEAHGAQVLVAAEEPIRGLLVRYPWVPSMGVRVLFPGLARGARGEATVRESLTRRGPLRTGPLVVSTASPLGLWNAERRLPGGQEVLVLPAVGELRGDLLLVARGGVRPQERPRSRRGDGIETWALRPFVPGDSPRRIHWPSTARLGEPVVRELEAESGGILVLGLGWVSVGRRTPQRLIEGAISLTATLVRTRFRAGGDTCVVVGDREPLLVAAGNRVVLGRLEEHLALLEGAIGWPDWDRVPDLVNAVQRVLVHPGSEPPPKVPGVEPIGVRRAIDCGEYLPRGAVP
jgi:uncharacterized protein (DUF58 family)